MGNKKKCASEKKKKTKKQASWRKCNFCCWNIDGFRDLGEKREESLEKPNHQFLGLWGCRMIRGIRDLIGI